jgi:hypothetical protein
MKSGLHAHFCENCQKDVDCPQITHCKRPATTPCIDCRAAEFAKHESGFSRDEEERYVKEMKRQERQNDFIEGLKCIKRAEEQFYQTGKKWPKE